MRARENSREAATSLLSSRSGHEVVLAVGLYDQSGRLIDGEGDALSTQLLPGSAVPAMERVRHIRAGDERGRWSLCPSVAKHRDGRLQARRTAAGALPAVLGLVVRTVPSTVSSASLLRFVALYTGTVAAALLVFLYFATTRLIVEPVVRLSLAARRVAEGARTLRFPEAARESWWNSRPVWSG